MLVVETIGRIRCAYFVQGKSIKKIARDLRLSRNTVCKVRALTRRRFLMSVRCSRARSSEGEKSNSIGCWPRMLKRRPEGRRGRSELVTARCSLRADESLQRRHSAAAGGEMLAATGPDLTRVIERAGWGLRSRSLSTCRLSAIARSAEAAIPASECDGG